MSVLEKQLTHKSVGPLASLRRQDDSSSEARAQKHFHEGLDLLEGKSRQNVSRGRPTTSEVEKASIKFRKAIFLEPGNKEFYHARADAALKLHDVRSAVSNLRFALKNDSNDGVTRRRLSKLMDVQGLSWLDVKSYEMALAYFDVALKLDPVQGIFHIHRAVALVYLEDYHKALRSVDDALSCMPAQADHYILRGKIYWALRLSDLGNNDFRRAQEMDPDHLEVKAFHQEMLRQAEALYERALAAMRHNQYDRAISALDQALGLSQNDLKLMILRGTAYRKIGNHQQSLDDLDDAAFIYYHQLKGDGDNPLPDQRQRRRLIGIMRMSDDYREPQQVTRERNLLFNDIALDLFTQGRHEQAITYLNRAIESEEKFMYSQSRSDKEVNFRFFLNRGDCYRAMGMLEQALSDFHRALDANPEDWQIKTRLSMIHYMYGNILFNKRQFMGAQTEFSRAIKHNPKVPIYHMQRGKACFYQQNIEGAYENYKNALELDPNNLEIKLLLQQFEPEVDIKAEKIKRQNFQKETSMVQSQKKQVTNDEIAQFSAFTTSSKKIDLKTINPHLAQAEKTLRKTKAKQAVVNSIFENRPQFQRDDHLWSLTKSRTSKKKKKASSFMTRSMQRSQYFSSNFS